MKGFRLPEYDPAVDQQQLHALLRLPAGLVPDFAKFLEQRCPGLVLRYRPAAATLLLIFPAAGDCQGYLLRLGEALDGFAGSSGGGPVELLETRLAAPAGSKRQPPPFSKYILLLDEGAASPAAALSLRLEYGTSFGSGQHPSTRLAMQALEQLFEKEKPFPARMLDVGCGTGILALAGGLFGAGEVLGVDIDAEALALAVENGQRNGLDARVGFANRPVNELVDPYDLVVANLTGAVLSGMLVDLARLVRRPEGWLVISGLLGRQLAEIGTALSSSGLAVRQTYQEGSWRAALLAAADSRP